MRTFTTNLLFFILTLCTFGIRANAQTTTARDTVRFVAERVVMEDDPNNHNYIFSLYSPDGQWKIQINYFADSMFGTFTTEDFNLSGSGRNYNYVRNPKNDMVFYSFTEMDLEVTDNVTTYDIKANCLASNRTRFIVEGSVEVAIPTDTIHSDLGYANVVANPFYGIYTLSAENDDYRLEYGVVGESLLGTFYRADLLMPELTDRHSGEKISIINATALHTIDADGTKRFAIDLISDDLLCYSFKMFNAPIEVAVKEEIDVDLGLECALQDLTEMYGCYQFGGQNDEYGVAIALMPEAIESGRREWGMDDIYLPYTTVLRMADGSRPTIHDVKASFSSEGYLATLLADILCLDGTLYHVRMGLQLPGYVPDPIDTVELDYGRVAVVDYTKGLGTVGLGGVLPGRSQMRLYLNAHNLEGEFTTDDIIPDLCDVMMANDDSFKFHDAWDVKASVTRDAADVLHFDIHMLCKDTVMYHATMYLPPLRCLPNASTGADQIDYDLSPDDGYSLVALREGTDGNYAEYTLQFGNADVLYDDESQARARRTKNNEPTAYYDGNLFSFYLGHEGPGLAGEYGYSAGTLAEDEPHLFFEDHTEVRVAPVAGTLNVTPLQPITIFIDGLRYVTSVYNVEFHFVGQNGIIYNGAGSDYLICIAADGDEDTLHYVEIKEPTIDSIRTALAAQGFTVRKTLSSDGRMLIVTPSGNYDARGISQNP